MNYQNKNDLNEIEEPLIILVGNKSDNIAERKIEKEDIEKFCDDYNVENYFEVSAKSGDNINDMFKSVVTQLYVNYIVPNYSDNHTNLANNTNKKVLSNNNGGFDNDKCNICSCLIY
jgi:GTPase SAR1 family protein